MRWTPVVILLIAIAIAVIVARGLPEDHSASGDNVERTESPTDDAVRAAAPARESE